MSETLWVWQDCWLIDIRHLTAVCGPSMEKRLELDGSYLSEVTAEAPPEFTSAFSRDSPPQDPAQSYACQEGQAHHRFGLVDAVHCLRRTRQ